jgi:hypothetical protein
LVDPSHTHTHNRRDLIITTRSCAPCERTHGTTQEEAVEESQQYKVGKFILEKTKLAKKTDLQ